jgi:hypothetical protein
MWNTPDQTAGSQQTFTQLFAGPPLQYTSQDEEKTLSNFDGGQISSLGFFPGDDSQTEENASLMQGKKSGGIEQKIARMAQIPH